MKERIKALLYCPKSKPYIDNRGNDITDYPDYVFDCEGINGSIPCECDYEVEEIYLEEYDDYNDSIYSKTYYETKTLQEDDLCKQSCLTADELDDYLKGENSYAIRIKNLNVFNEPKKTSEYNTYNRNGKVHIADIPIYTAPRNMMYAFDYYGNPFVLISVRPELMCKILNGECDIIVKKKVLKGMIENDK